MGPGGTALGHVPSLGEPQGGGEETTGLGLPMPLGGGQGDTRLYNRARPCVSSQDRPDPISSAMAPLRSTYVGTSLMVQCLRLHAPKAGVPGFDPKSGN